MTSVTDLDCGRAKLVAPDVQSINHGATDTARSLTSFYASSLNSQLNRRLLRIA